MLSLTSGIACKNSQHSALSTQHSALSTQHSALSTQHSALSTQHSALSRLLCFEHGTATGISDQSTVLLEPFAFERFNEWSELFSPFGDLLFA